MKKKIIFYLVLFIASSTAFGQQKFTIQGHLHGLDMKRTIMLSYSIEGQKHLDSSTVQNGAFSFTGTVAEPIRATLTLKPSPQDRYDKYRVPDSKTIFLENTYFMLTSDTSLSSAKVKGGSVHQDFTILEESQKSVKENISRLIGQIRDKLRKDDTTSIDELYSKLPELRKKMSTLEEEFILNHPRSYVSLDLLRSRATVIDMPVFEPMFKALSPELKNTVTGKAIQARLASAKITSVGQPAFPFTQNDTNGKPFSLASLKGKYVLIDFWASWCMPCRMENPNLVRAYAAFKNKNLEIVGVSLDDKKEPWLEAIRKDGLPWIHISDLKGWKNEVAQMYGIQGIPQNVLVDPNGIIIAKNLRGKELEQKLAAFIK